METLGRVCKIPVWWRKLLMEKCGEFSLRDCYCGCPERKCSKFEGDRANDRRKKYSERLHSYSKINKIGKYMM
jgi:hypothetical protein